MSNLVYSVQKRFASQRCLPFGFFIPCVCIKISKRAQTAPAVLLRNERGRLGRGRRGALASPTLAAAKREEGNESDANGAPSKAVIGPGWHTRIHTEERWHAGATRNAGGRETSELPWKGGGTACPCAASSAVRPSGAGARGACAAERQRVEQSGAPLSGVPVGCEWQHALCGQTQHGCHRVPLLGVTRWPQSPSAH